MVKIIDIFKQLEKEYPEAFTLSGRIKQLDLIDSPWNIARVEGFKCMIHDFTQNTIDDFIVHEYHSDVLLNYNRLVTVYLTEPQKIYDSIIKSMAAYYELQKQARLKLSNKQVDQMLKNLD